MNRPIPMLDLMFFLTESQDNPRHVGAYLIFERPARARGDIVTRIVEAYRAARPVAPFNRVPVFGQGLLPEWREVDALDADRHVQHLVLPPPGSDAQLHQLVAELHAPVLDRHRPGWKVFVIDGLERNRFAMFFKVHHALIDGESGMALLQRTLSSTPRDRRVRCLVSTTLPGPGRRVRDEPSPGLERRVGDLVHRVASIGQGAVRLAEESLGGLRGTAPGSARAFTAPFTPMNEPIRSARTVTHVVLPLEGMRQIAKAWGGTVNDAALCVLDAGMNEYLRGLDRRPARPLVAICPVSLQDPESKEASTQVSIFWTPLGTPSAPISRRMREVVANTKEAKQRIRSLPRDAAYAYSVLSFAMGETLARVPRQSADFLLASNVLISNVRGPEKPLYLGGARLEVLCPVSTLISGMGLNITLMSYAGKVVIGYTANASALPDAGQMAEHARKAFATLDRLSRRRAPPPATARRSRGRRAVRSG